jgi:hypothetical protein
MSDTPAPTATPADPAGTPAPAATQTPAPTGGGLLTSAAPPTTQASGAPPAPPSGFFGEHIAKDGQFNEGWTESLRQAGFERLATKAAMAKDEATLFKTLDEVIGFVGKKPTGASYPKDGATAEEISAFRHSAGVPDTAEAYNLKPENLPDGVEWPADGVKPYAELFHKHHIPESAAKELVAMHLEQLTATAGEDQAQHAQKVQQFVAASEQTFAKEWGDQYDTRLEANRAFVQSRFGAEDLQDPSLQAALSHPQVVRLVDEARRALRDSPLPGVGQEMANGSHSPRQQAVEIMRANPKWMQDPDLTKRVNDLYSLDAAQAKRRK